MPAPGPEVAAPTLQACTWSVAAHRPVAAPEHQSPHWGVCVPGTSSSRVPAGPGPPGWALRWEGPALSAALGRFGVLPWGQERGIVCFLLSPGLALELSPPAYTRATTRAWVPLRGPRVQRGPGVPPDGVGGGRPRAAVGTPCLLWACTERRPDSHEDASCAGPGALAFKPLPGGSVALGPRLGALTAGEGKRAVSRSLFSVLSSKQKLHEHK